MTNNSPCVSRWRRSSRAAAGRAETPTPDVSGRQRRPEHRPRARRGRAGRSGAETGRTAIPTSPASGRAAARSAISSRGMPKGEDDPAERRRQARHGVAAVERRSGGELPADRRAAHRAVSLAHAADADARVHPVRRQHPQLPADLHGRPQASRTIPIRPGTATRSATTKATRWSWTRSASTTSSGSTSAAIRTPRSCTRSSGTRGRTWARSSSRRRSTDPGVLHEAVHDHVHRAPAARRRADGIHLPGERTGRRAHQGTGGDAIEENVERNVERRRRT